jgi:hypothetical protein
MMRSFVLGWLLIGPVIFVALGIMHFANHPRADSKMYLMDPRLAAALLSDRVECQVVDAPIPKGMLIMESDKIVCPVRPGQK